MLHAIESICTNAAFIECILKILLMVSIVESFTIESHMLNQNGHCQWINNIIIADLIIIGKIFDRSEIDGGIINFQILAF